MTFFNKSSVLNFLTILSGVQYSIPKKEVSFFLHIEIICFSQWLSNMVPDDQLLVNSNFSLIARKGKKLKSEDISASVLIFKYGNVSAFFTTVDSNCKYIFKTTISK